MALFFSDKFICGSTAYSTLEKAVAAPYLRKSFLINSQPEHAEIRICGLGFYELYINGTRITKGALAPYITAPDQIIYYDDYDVTPYLHQGENVIGILLGNGTQNAFGAFVWDFDKSLWRSSPKVAMMFSAKLSCGDELVIESDTSFKTASSPIICDDLRLGEQYDARLKIEGWNLPGFDDSNWENALPAEIPRGEKRLCGADPIVVTDELRPVSITKEGEGYRYDFGVNSAGLCRLSINGTAGQKIELYHGEVVVDDCLYTRNLVFRDGDVTQHDIYVCDGSGNEAYIPHFTYHGFRYVLVKGITEQQATPELLTYLVMNSDLKERGGFSCSDETANKLQEITRRSDLANFYYFPTDCPQREKNGWTADAALSAEHMLLNLSPEKSYREWMRLICATQNKEGQLPGIIPTGGWGFHWGNGPAWDCVIVEIPYYTYIYRKDKEILKLSATSIMRYLHYITTKIRADGLVCFGLGDWCPPDRQENLYLSPLEFTDSVLTMEIARKAAFIFRVLKMAPQQHFAEEIQVQMRVAVRKHLIDLGTMTAAGNCQTSQAMALYYHIFEDAERHSAFAHLLDIIEKDGRFMQTGVLGARVMFHVLSEFGRSDLAFEMITRPEHPSYGNLVKRSATSLWEAFHPEGGRILSQNHHFWGDISSWFIRCLAGIQFNPHHDNHNEVNIRPSFIPQLTSASGFHDCPSGRITSEWKRENERIILKLQIPEKMAGFIYLENGYYFVETDRSLAPATSGEYLIYHKADRILK